MRVLLAFLLFCSLSGTAQVYRSTLNGKLTMETGEVFTYRLELADSQGYISGYSYTYDAPNDTKAPVSGMLDRQRGVLNFKETDIVYAHNTHPKAFMCLVHAKLVYKNNTLTGTIANQQLDRTACTPGKLDFRNGEELNTLFGSHDKYDVAVEMGGRKNKPAETSAIVEKPKDTVLIKAEQITQGIEKSYIWSADSVVLELWDGGTVDGDVVTILFDGKPVLPRAPLFKNHRRLAIPLPKMGVHRLEILAEEEGSDPPATATLILWDGNRHYDLVAYNKKNARSMVNITRAK